MSYMGLFWETGMPEAWTLSRRAGDRPEASLTGDGRLDPGIVSRLWTQNMADPDAQPGIPGPSNVVPGDNAGRPVPKPDSEKTKD